MSRNEKTKTQKCSKRVCNAWIVRQSTKTISQFIRHGLTDKNELFCSHTLSQVHWHFYAPHNDYSFFLRSKGAEIVQC